jgi:hypothetical protein
MPTKKKHNPKQVFVALSSTREEIAEKLNGVMYAEGWDAPKFTPDDPRLTDKLCQDVVDGTQSAVCDVDEVVDVEYAYHKANLASLLGIEDKE